MFVSMFNTVATLQLMCSATYADGRRHFLTYKLIFILNVVNTFCLSLLRASVLHVVNMVSKDRLETSDQLAFGYVALHQSECMVVKQFAQFGNASVHSKKFRGIRPRMYIEDLI